MLPFLCIPQFGENERQRENNCIYRAKKYGSGKKMKQPNWRYMYIYCAISQLKQKHASVKSSPNECHSFLPIVHPLFFYFTSCTSFMIVM